MTRNLVRGKYEPTIPFPILDQIQGYKRRNGEYFKSNGTDEFELVTQLLENIKYKDDIDENTAFCYGVKLGTGSDNDLLSISFTSKKLLKNINQENTMRIFHIDGTYKLINNKFSLIAYGRSDINGQFHLIACAIVSSESKASYVHFYR